MSGLGLLTAAQVAEQAGCTARTVLRWVETGKLEAAHRLPGETGLYLFTPEVVERFLAEETHLVRRTV
jgi:excisionase family DNA binding protein